MQRQSMTTARHQFFPALRAILKHPCLTATERLVAIAILHDRDNTTGISRPSIARLANMTALSACTVSRTITALKAKGLLQVVKTAQGNLYRLILPPRKPYE